MNDLKDKNVIVTGGGSGIGRALCHRLAEAGANVGVFDINPEGAEITNGWPDISTLQVLACSVCLQG